MPVIHVSTDKHSHIHQRKIARLSKTSYYRTVMVMKQYSRERVANERKNVPKQYLISTQAIESKWPQVNIHNTVPTEQPQYVNNARVNPFITEYQRESSNGIVTHSISTIPIHDAVQYSPSSIILAEFEI